METFLDLMLIRFALVAGGLVVLALLAFAIALHLKRRGRLDDVRRYADPLVKAGLQAAALAGFLEIDGLGGGVHGFTCSIWVLSNSNSWSVSSVLRFEDRARLACAPCPYGESHTQTRRSRTYSMAKTPTMSKAHPR